MKIVPLIRSLSLVTLGATPLLACTDGHEPSTQEAPPLGARPAPLLRHAPPLESVVPSLRDRTLSRGARKAAAINPSAVPAAPNGDPPIPAKYQAFAAAFDSERQSLGAPGAAVAIIEHGEVTFAHGFGTKGPSSTAPVDARTLFRIGSMTKALTAATFLQLADEGKAGVHEKLTDLVPNVALSGPDLAPLTLKDVLSQQSGLFDFTNDDVATDPFIPGTDPTSPLAYVTGTTFAQNEFFLAPPRALWAYSNANFIVTGAAIEQASGTDYVSAMEYRLLRPLGMTRTFFHPSQVTADGDYSNGLSTNADGTPWNVAPGDYDYAWCSPAAFAFSSVEDYARFVQFLYRGDPAVLSDSSREAMQAPHVDTVQFGDIESYGYGLFTDTGFNLSSDYYTMKLVTHTGGVPGFASEFFLVPETGFGLVTFANTDGAYFGPSLELAFQSFGGLTAPTTTLPASTQNDPSAFPRYAGTYLDESAGLGEMIIQDQGGALTIALPDLDAEQIPYETALVETSNNNFVLTLEGEYAQEVAITFVPERRDHRTGPVDWLLIDIEDVAARVEPDAGE